MMRVDNPRIDPKRQSKLDPRRRQFAEAEWKQQSYPYRLNFYTVPPTADITLEEFEEWAINRLKILAELEACSFRNRTADETAEYMRPLLQKHLPLSANSSKSSTLQEERKKDHYSHFILRLAFSATEDLRRRFSRLETQLFKLRFQQDDALERQSFIESLDFEWEKVGEEEKKELEKDLLGMLSDYDQKRANNVWFKVDWEQVPELVESRKVMLKRGKAYVPAKEQASLVVSEFTRRLDAALTLTSRALPRLDENDRLTPILKHLSTSFTAPDASFTDSDASLPGATGTITASSIDPLSAHFPLCMSNLHRTLRANSHLKHYGRLQYTLFLKGLGLSLEECLVFWRKSFRLMDDKKFGQEYRYNIRHAYGDVGGDANRRGRGYTPYSCQKLLTEPLPGPGQSHGCPYRVFTTDNLVSLLQQTGVSDREVLKGVREDVEKKRYHIACNRVFEHAHKRELQKVKSEGTWRAEDLDLILHPNAYFKRSWMLKNLGKADVDGQGDVKMEGA